MPHEALILHHPSHACHIRNSPRIKGTLRLGLALGGLVTALFSSVVNAESLVPRQLCVTGAGGTGFAGQNPCEVTTTNSAGETIISQTNGIITIPTGATAPITATLSDETTTIEPGTLLIVNINSAGETVINGAAGAVTIPESLTTTLVTELPNGQTTTFGPDSDEEGSDQPATTVTNGQTIISNSDGILTLPTAITIPFETTLPGGATTTITPQITNVQTGSASPTDSGAAALIVPITTPVSESTPTPGGAVVPCDYFWFFDLCLNWDDEVITGWQFPWPPGDHPPGPPPGINPPPGISISIPIPLPRWPHVTVPPNGVPTPDPKPDECKTETGEVCFYKTDVSTVTSDQATTTTSEVQSTCATVIGCDAMESSTATTATATATQRALNYAVYPSNGADADQVSAISSQLKSIVADPDTVQATTAKYYGLLYWTLPLNESAAKKVEAVQDVGSMWLECDKACPKDDPMPCYVPCYDPSTALVYDDLSWMNPVDFAGLSGTSRQNIVDQMTYLSQAPPADGQPVGPRAKEFIFDDSAGGGVDVYILDTGATLEKSEFDLIRNRVNWLPVDLADEDKNDGTNGAADGYHGTAMLSLIAGRTLGIAKEVNPIVVRLPAPRDTGEVRDGQPVFARHTPQDWLNYLGMIDTDLGPAPTSQQEARAVVLLATYYPRSIFTGPTTGFENTMYNLLTSIVSKGAIVVTGSGNIPKRAQAPLDGWPANFGKHQSQNGRNIPSMIVAGAVSGSGATTKYKTDPEGGVPHVYAPGVDVYVANGNPDFPFVYVSSSGTSDAAAYTTGLAAYYMRLAQIGALNYRSGGRVPTTPQGIKDFIVNQAFDDPAGTAWSRQQVDDVDRPGIFNNIDPRMRRCLWDPDQNNQPPGRFKRDSGAACMSGLASPSDTPTSSSVSDTAPSASPTTPLQINPVVCHDGADFPGHGDIAKSAVSMNSRTTCTDWSDEEFGLQLSEPLSRTVTTAGIRYQFDVAGIDGCVTTVDSQNVFSPLGPDTPRTQDCDDIFWDCFRNCTGNGGVGGYSDVGCLRYTFTGGK